MKNKTLVKVKNVISHKGIPVVEGKLVLIRINEPMSVIVGEKTINAYKPILISETEEILVGDSVLCGNEIILVDTKTKVDFLKDKLKTLGFTEEQLKG